MTLPITFFKNNVYLAIGKPVYFESLRFTLKNNFEKIFFFFFIWSLFVFKKILRTLSQVTPYIHTYFLSESIYAQRANTENSLF